MSQDSKSALRVIADLLYVQAADAHAEGMALTERSARIRQLAHILTDEEAAKLLHDLQEEGVAPLGVACTSSGGEA